MPKIWWQRCVCVCVNNFQLKNYAYTFVSFSPLVQQCICYNKFWLLHHSQVTLNCFSNMNKVTAKIMVISKILKCSVQKTDKC